MYGLILSITQYRPSAEVPYPFSKSFSASQNCLDF